MLLTETILERTDRMLGVIEGGPVDAMAHERRRDAIALWNSGLSGNLLFSVGRPPANSSAEADAQNIVDRYLERAKHQPSTLAMSEMVDLQRALQMRSKVMSAIEMLMCG